MSVTRLRTSLSRSLGSSAVRSRTAGSSDPSFTSTPADPDADAPSEAPDESPEEAGPALFTICGPDAAWSGAVTGSSGGPLDETSAERPDEASDAEADKESGTDDADSGETSAGSSEVGAAIGTAPSNGGGASQPGSATAAQGCAATAPPVADTAARSRPETSVARRGDIRGVIAGTSSI